MGGGQRILLSLAEAARVTGWRVGALLPVGPCADALRQAGTDVHAASECRLSEGNKGLWDVIALLWHALRILCCHMGALRRADLLYANGGHMYLPCFLASLLLRTPAVYHLHLNPSTGHIALLRLCLRSRHTRRLVVVSPFIARVLRDADAAFDDSRIQIVENGLDERFSKLAFKDRFTGKPLRHIGVLGRVCYEKGQDVLLSLAAAFPHMAFHILGDSAFYSREYLDDLKSHSPGNVHFHGWVEDIPGKVDAIGLQICLVPSRCPRGEETRLFEGSSLVLMQMLALSCLVIPRRLGVLADMAQDFGLPSFESDEELPALLRDLAAWEDNLLVRTVHKNFDAISSGYSCVAFQQRLRIMFDELLKESP